MSEIVHLPGKKPSANVEAQQANDFLGSARLVADAAVLDRLAYERTRLAIAKRLGCRASFLDKLVDRINEQMAAFKYRFQDAFRVEVRPINYEGKSAWSLIFGIRKEDDARYCLVLLADGSFSAHVGVMGRINSEGSES